MYSIEIEWSSSLNISFRMSELNGTDRNGQLYRLYVEVNGAVRHAIARARSSLRQRGAVSHQTAPDIDGVSWTDLSHYNARLASLCTHTCTLRFCVVRATHSLIFG